MIDLKELVLVGGIEAIYKACVIFLFLMLVVSYYQRRTGEGERLGLLSFPVTFKYFFCDTSKSRAKTGLTFLRCMKLQNPPRIHSDVSCCRQHASRKSVTGESSA